MRELRLLSVEIKNFRSIQNILFDFSENKFVLIVGNNGAGKTTIFSGVTWAAYDETVDGISGDDIVNNKIGKNTEVFLKFTDGVDNYEIRAYRKHKKFQNKRFLLKNDVDISENTAKDTLSKIEKILMPKPVFMNCLLFSQFIKGNFLKQTHSGQKEILDLMLGLGRYDTYYENGKELEKRANLEVEKIRAKSSVDSSLTQEIKQEIADSATKKIEINDLYTRRLQDCEVSGKSIAAELAKFKSLLPEYDQYDIQRDNLSNKIAALTQQLDSLKTECDGEIKHATGKVDATAIKTRIESEFLTKLSNMDQQQSQLKIKRSQVTTEYTQFAATKESVYTKSLSKIEEKKRDTCKEIEDLLTDLRQQHISVTDLIKLATKSINENNEVKTKITNALNQEVAICDRCKQPLTSKTAIKHMQEELARIDGLIKEFEKEHGIQTRAAKRISDRGLRTKSQLTGAQTKFDSEIEAHKSQYKTFMAEEKLKWDGQLKNLDDQLAKLITQHTTLSKQMTTKVDEAVNAEKAALGIEISTIKEKYRELGNSKFAEKTTTQTELDGVNSKLRERDDIKNQLNATEVKLATAKTTYTGLKTQQKNELINIDNRVEQLNSKLVEISDRAAESQKSIATIDKRINILKFWKTAYSDTGLRGIILDDAIPTLNHRAKELCALVPEIQVRFDSTRDTKSGASRNKFTVTALQTDKLSTYDQMSSGEKRLSDIIVLLCLRHLLEETSQCKINIMLLDEILDSLDPENAINAVNMFKLLSRDHCVVLISHTMRDAIDADQLLRM